jgi:hypothetical protein
VYERIASLLTWQQSLAYSSPFAGGWQILAPLLCSSSMAADGCLHVPHCRKTTANHSRQQILCCGDYTESTQTGATAPSSDFE